MRLEEYERMYQAEEGHWWYAGMRAISFALLDGALPETMPDGRRPRILDVGCGTGNNLVHLGRRGQAVGLDLSDEALRFCRTRVVTVVRAETMRLPFPDGAFDCVTCFDVLYHRWVKDDRAAAAEMARVLRPGGLLLLRLPALEILRRAHDEAVHTRHRYTRGEVKALLRAAGLEVRRATYCNSLLLPFVVVRSALDSLFGSQASDLAPLPHLVEWTFRTCLMAEARLVRGASLPLGASVVALGRKP
ncbi:MAG: methyltransferase domain-containing protein [Acidobacteria bacterium]|nr:methyltransferase domain-containing protein [Acidobacteriota bacterium]